ncbi:methyltransferase family protein [Nioella nitratireducens]|uniref:methyltransferase family protein n=1 Tax=Nioella nitratireducens TaxID=1287720 RepID=UPI0008FD58DA|nr:PEMT/PEM2 methyltransferase family protein [Nioella nitratireducens]
MVETETALTILLTATLAVGLLAAAVLCGLLIWTKLHPGFGFWPAPDKTGWRHITAMSLFRTFCGSVVVYAVLAVIAQGWGHPLHYLLGLPVMAAAYGVTLWGYKSLGIENTYCGADGLVTGGLYAYSRNPQYVSSVLATLGLAITAGSWTVLGLAGVLFGIYFLFAINEERWLTRGYGRAFRDYMRRTPRFVGLRSLERARQEILARG